MKTKSIYALITNGKIIYIGNTSNIYHRIAYHKTKSRNNPKFPIHKFLNGKDFTYEILEEGLTEEQAKEREEHFITFYNTIEEGLNIYRGAAIDEGTKKLMSELCQTKRSINVHNKKTGEFVATYESIKECARQLNLFQPNISLCLNKNYKSFKSHCGYIFKYTDDTNQTITFTDIMSGRIKV